MSVFLLENCWDGYEKSIEGIFSTFETILEKLKGEHPNGVLEVSKLKDEKYENQWFFTYKPYENDGDGWEDHTEFYSITEMKVL